MDWTQIASDALGVLAHIGAFAAFLFLARLAKDLLTPYRLVDELGHADNLAVGLSVGGYFLATAIIFMGAVLGPSAGLKTDLISTALYAGLGLVFLNLTRIGLDRVFFTQFCNNAAIVEQQNLGLGAVRGGAYVATGLVAAASIYGEGGGIVSSIVFFAAGQVALFGFAQGYDLVTPYRLGEEIKSGNAAAGVGFGGTLIALGLILAKSISGPFIGWVDGLVGFAISVGIGVVLLFIARSAIDRVILPGHNLNREIAQDRNVAFGVMEMAVALSFALVLVSVL